MMNDPLLSIVIPVYNQERYLERCLFSIEKQNKENVEVIIVNDGSSDGSQSVIDKYVNRNSNFHSFQQNNQGVSAARNLGIRQVHGKYLTFLDSDDAVTDDYIDVLLKQLENDLELLCFDAYKIKSNKKEQILYTNDEIQTLNNMEGLTGYLDQSLYDKMEGYCWNKVFKTDITKKYHIHFDIRKRIAEDAVFCAAYCSRIHKIHFIPNVLYNYYIQEESLTKGYKFYAVQDYMYFIDCFLDIAKDNNYELDPHELLAFYIGWWFSAIDDESYSHHYKKGIRNIDKFLHQPYFIENKKNIRFRDLSLKRKTYYILIKCHCSRFIFSILYLKNSIL